MDNRRMIEILERRIFPKPDTNAPAWLAHHRGELEAGMDVALEGARADYLRFQGLLRNGKVIWLNTLFWRGEESLDSDQSLIEEFNLALGEFFFPPDTFETRDLHAQGEGLPKDTAEAVAFLEKHGETLTMFLTLRRFQLSDYFKNL